MTSYHGGKQRIGPDIANHIYSISTLIEQNTDFVIKGYCEPFCGMLGVYRHMYSLLHSHYPKLKYKAGDANESVIKMWQRSQNGWVPPVYVSENEYNRLKISKESALKGYVGHQFSFGGQYFKGYIGKYKNIGSQQSASDRICEIADELDLVEFSSGSYEQFSKLKNYIIYCDPPYGGGVQSFYNSKFCHEQFWNWVRKMSVHNIIFVSEYKAPKDFTTIMNKKHTVNVKGRDAVGREKLFMYKN